MTEKRWADITVALDEDRVAVVEMHRPPANHFDVDLLHDIGQAFDWAESNGARAIMLCSEGKHFCAGANFTAKKASGTSGLDRTLYDNGLRLFDAPLPIVAAVQGGAIGGGLGLALVADLRVASPETRFSANFVTLGFSHGFGISVTLPEAVGTQHAKDLLLTGRRVDGTEAFRIGLCDRLSASTADLRADALTLAALIARNGPLGVAASRRAIRLGLPERAKDAVAREFREQQRLATSHDFVEGVRAARDRRQPQFEGR